ncbi:MAG: metallophosphoesterase family protein [Endomicrobiales bacterium]
MKILAVSDAPSSSLESLIERSPERFKDISLIVSCGDLDREYLEFLAEGVKRELFFVCGNHPSERINEFLAGDSVAERIMGRFRNYQGRILDYIAGCCDLHGRVEVFRKYLVAGFGGSMWYNGRENQFTEKEMARVVRRVERNIHWHLLQDALLGRRKREVIVISHAPILNVHDQADPCHKGFKCFREMVRRIAPLLWIHGHIHLQDMRQSQVSILGGATVVNAFGCKIIEINRSNIQVYSHHKVDKG